jgi:hypothetical protein
MVQLLRGKQTATDIVIIDGTRGFTGVVVGISPTLADHLATKEYVDALAGAGVTWKNPVAVRHYVGNFTIVGINGLTPASGDAVVATSAGTPAAGTSDILVIGDLAEYNGTEWKKIVSASGGFVPLDTLAIVSEVSTIGGGLTDGVDDGKVASWDGVSNTPTLTADVDGDARLVNGDGSIFENCGHTFDGVVPTGTWIQFTGAGLITAGTGLSKAGDTLNVGGGDGINANPDDLEVDPYSGADTSVAPLLVDVDGAGVDTDDSTIDHTAGVLGVKALGITSGELASSAVTAAKIATSAVGDGLTGGAGIALTADLDGDSLAKSGAGIKGAVLAVADKVTVSAVTSGDEDTTGVTISATPAGDGWVGVIVNTAGPYELGDAVKTKTCYFSDDGGTTAKSIGAVASGDTLFWNGTITGFDLDTSDEISLIYAVIL